MRAREAWGPRAAGGARPAFAGPASPLKAPVGRSPSHLPRRPDLADEAAQETWARAIRSLRHFRGESTVQTWLLGIARRVVAGLLEEQNRKPAARQPSAPSVSIGLVEVGLALATLPQGFKEGLVLTQVVGLSY